MANSAAETLNTMEKLFAKNHEPFFNTIAQLGPQARSELSPQSVE
jgi:hypothetical protein